MSHDPVTLGDKLLASQGSGKSAGARLRHALFTVLNAALLLAIIGTAVWWYSGPVDTDPNVVIGILAALMTLWAILAWIRRAPEKHFLLANDQQGFMRDLRLDDKTAIFDGSNIYHFGRSNGQDALPLGEVAQKLRNQGYRIVCFFDANIFFTLGEHGAFSKRENHSVAMLQTIFGLNADEIYVVPAGVQADGYILECLSHLSVSFAVTNDRFRDYARTYPQVMKDSLWRKGVVISNGEVELLKHRF